LVHRDISPQNILVTYDGVSKVCDFGVAKATALGGGATVAGQIKGKVAYMAPEQVKGGAIDRRVDLFAMGIVLYALTTGKHPFRRESEAATMYNICSPTPVMPPRKVIADYPSELELVILKSLSKDPARRYQTANEMLKALDQLPQTMRASTDDDVGKFVMSLFGDKRAERQTAMTEALARAEELARSRAAGPLSMGSELMQQGAHSQVSYVTRTGVTANNEFSGIPTTAATGAMTGFGQNSPRRKLVMGAAMVALGLLAVGLVVALKSRSATTELSQTSASQTTTTAPSVASGAATPGTLSTSDSSVPAASATSSEGASSASAEASAEPANKNNHPNAKPPKTAASATVGGPASSAAPKVKQQWKQDPGF